MDKDVNIKKIAYSIEELSSFFSFFKKNELKKELFFTLELVENDLKTIPILKENLDKCTERYDNLTEEYSLYKKDSQEAFTTLNKSIQQYEDELKLKNKEIAHTKKEADILYKKSLLVAKLLSAKAINEGLKEYKKVLYNEFFSFANKEESLANEAEAFFKLQSIEKELEIIAAYPNLHKKNTIAIGGSFSAGKSEFISSFFEDNIKLPISIEPTTAIPAYVISETDNKIIGCSNQGGIVDLRTIDDNFYSKISHDFIQSFDFNLKDIMPFMIVGTKMEYKNICFIDTPGYNPAHTDESYTRDDITTAKEFLENTSTLIWLIGLDANGTISSNDIDFLTQLDIDNKKVYIVLNKADLRAGNTLEEIIKEISTILDDYDIEYIGISAFSSLEKKEYTHLKTSIFDFIASCNEESEVHEKLIKKLFTIHLMYKRAILTTIKEKKTIESHIQSVLLDMIEGFDDTSNAFQKLNKLKTIFSEKEQEENLKLLDDVVRKLKKSIDNIFGKELSVDFTNITLDDIAIDFDLSINMEEKPEDIKQDNKEQKHGVINLLDILQRFQK